MKQERAERYRRQHAENIARLRAIAGKPLPPRRTRIALAVTYVAVLAVLVALPLVFDASWATLAQLGALLVLFGMLFALNRSTRLITEGPEEVLDELLVRLRHRYFRDAYLLLAGAAGVTAAVLLVGSAGGTGIGVALGSALGWGLIGVVLGLPQLVAAVRLPDLDDEPVPPT